jgi:L-amino acid N-acyltransferase YncA
LVSSRKDNGVATGPLFLWRRATSGDAQLLLDWRNDPITVVNSKSGATVSPQEHARWFQAALKNENAVLFIAEIDQRPIAMTRFDRADPNSSNFFVSINLSPSQRGKGLGSALLRSAVFEFQGLKKVNLVAEIRYGNVASEKIFKSAGFVESVAQRDFKQFIYFADHA